jgi:hypothetical protein
MNLHVILLAGQTKGNSHEEGARGVKLRRRKGA